MGTVPQEEITQAILKFGLEPTALSDESIQEANSKKRKVAADKKVSAKHVSSRERGLGRPAPPRTSKQAAGFQAEWV